MTIELSEEEISLLWEGLLKLDQSQRSILTEDGRYFSKLWIRSVEEEHAAVGRLLARLQPLVIKDT